MAAPAVEWRYAPKVVHDYLCPEVDHGTPPHPPGVLPSDVRVATEVPADRPAKLVTISTVPASGGTNLALSRRWVIIHVYHADEKTAGELAETVYGHMMSARFTPGSHIYNVVPVGTPGRFDDPDDATPRFQMTLEILLRATPVTP